MGVENHKKFKPRKKMSSLGKMVMQGEGLEKYIDHPEWPLCITQRRRNEGERKWNWNSSKMKGEERYV